MKLSHIIKKLPFTAVGFCSNLLIFLQLTSCSSGGNSEGSAKTQESSTRSDAGKGKTEPSDEFEQSSPPSNVSGSYLASCVPQSSPESGLRSDKVMVICSYRNPLLPGKPVEGQLTKGEVEISLSNGKKVVLKLQQQSTSSGKNIVESQFEISKSDFQQAEEIRHIELQVNKNGKRLKLSSKNISSEIALPQAQLSMQGSGNPDAPKFGLVGKVYALPDNFVDKLSNSSVSEERIDLFAGLPSTDSLGTVELPPWYLRKPDKFLIDKSEDFLNEASSPQNYRQTVINATKNRLIQEFLFTPEGIFLGGPLERFVGGFRISNKVNTKEFFVRLEGKIKFPKSGNYYLRVEANTAAQVFISNKPILSAVPRSIQDLASEATLNDATKRRATEYPIRVDYIFSQSSNTKLKMKYPSTPALSLSWKKPNDDGNFNDGGKFAVIPYWNLKP